MCPNLDPLGPKGYSERQDKIILFTSSHYTLSGPQWGPKKGIVRGGMAPQSPTHLARIIGLRRSPARQFVPTGRKMYRRLWWHFEATEIFGDSSSFAPAKVFALLARILTSIIINIQRKVACTAPPSRRGYLNFNFSRLRLTGGREI